MTLSDLYSILIKRKAVFLLVLVVSWAALSVLFLTKTVRYNYQMALRIPGYHKINSATPNKLRLIYSSGQVSKQFGKIAALVVNEYKQAGNPALYQLAKRLSAATTVWSNPYDFLLFIYAKKDQAPLVNKFFNDLIRLYATSQYLKPDRMRTVIKAHMTVQFNKTHHHFATAAQREAALKKFLAGYLTDITYVPMKVTKSLVRISPGPESTIALVILALLLSCFFSTVVVTLDKCFKAIKDGLSNGAH